MNPEFLSPEETAERLAKWLKPEQLVRLGLTPAPKISRLVRTIVYEGTEEQIRQQLVGSIPDGRYHWLTTVTISTGTETPEEAYARGFEDGKRHGGRE